MTLQPIHHELPPTGVDAMLAETLQDDEYQSGLAAARSSLPEASDYSIATFAATDDAVEQLNRTLGAHRPFDGFRLRHNGLVRRVGTLIAIGSVAAPVALGVNMLINAGDQTTLNRTEPIETGTNTTLSEAGNTCIDNAMLVYTYGPDNDIGHLIASVESCRLNDRYGAVPSTTGK